MKRKNKDTEQKPATNPVVKATIIPEDKNVQDSKPIFRQPTFTIAPGSKGIGKTYTTKKIAEFYVTGNKQTGTLPRKVLFFDPNNEFQGIKTIPVDHAFDKSQPNWILAFSSKKFKVEARRVVPTKRDGSNMSVNELNIVLAYILENYFGGLLVVEDPAKYISDTVAMDLTGGLATIRHRNCDVICHFQWKSKALHPKLWGNINLLRLHKTTDSFKKYKSRIEGQEEILYLAEHLVKLMNAKKRLNATKEQLIHEKEIPIETFYCYVDMDSTKIRGAFTRADFEEAILKYIGQNKKDAMDDILNEIDVKGNKVYTFEEAFAVKKQELMRLYYGN